MNEVTRERAQSFLTADRLQRVVDAYRACKDEPGFSRVLSIPSYVAGGTQQERDDAVESAQTALPDALTAWIESSSAVRRSLEMLLKPEK